MKIALIIVAAVINVGWLLFVIGAFRKKLKKPPTHRGIDIYEM